eukprot:6194703-Pleurochrysis_carterae.AAC.1
MSRTRSLEGRGGGRGKSGATRRHVKRGYSVACGRFVGARSSSTVHSRVRPPGMKAFFAARCRYAGKPRVVGGCGIVAGAAADVGMFADPAGRGDAAGREGGRGGGGGWSAMNSCFSVAVRTCLRPIATTAQRASIW